jgi:hypothetical protein
MEAEVDEVIREVVRAVRYLRTLNPLHALASLQ